MSKKGSALMQVLVVGLIIAAFSVLMLRYAVTRSANLTRTERILSSQIIADSCLDQYMALMATMELSGNPYNEAPTMNCMLYQKGQDTPSGHAMHGSKSIDTDGSYMIITTFTIPVVTTTGD